MLFWGKKRNVRLLSDIRQNEMLFWLSFLMNGFFHLHIPAAGVCVRELEHER